MRTGESSMNGAAGTWRDLRGTGKKALVPYLTPDNLFKGMTVPLLQQLAQAGADLDEVGVPFSDPIADGKTIQHSSEVALRHGVALDSIFPSIEVFRQNSEIPVILMSYNNPILHYCMRRFSTQASSSGVDDIFFLGRSPFTDAALDTAGGSFGH